MFPNEKGVEDNKIYLGINQDAPYPESINHYSPDELFPEYPFKDDPLSSANNVYRLIREGFLALGYDSDNCGKSCWNPLGSFISPGERVLIKPNWVMHFNKNEAHKDNMDCLITHPSVVRAIIDYVHIALNNSGEIIVADAPMQGCNLEQLLTETGYLDLLEFYKSKGIKIEFADLRERKVISYKGLITKIIPVNSEEEAVIVNLGNISFHSHNDKAIYKVSDYSVNSTNNYHCQGKHAYSISKKILQSDCIINIPKPKTHRLAGITAAQKNIVGIVYDKASLPHRIIGSSEEGGDEYQNRSGIKKLIADLEEVKLKCTENGKVYASAAVHMLIGMLSILVKSFCRDKTILGSWYGNDTIWRTVADLNYIVKYADKEGNLSDWPQRSIISILDMFIAGQGNGPIAPHPKELSIILMGQNTYCVDLLCAKIMGFTLDKIPGMKEMPGDPDSFNVCKAGVKIASNSKKFNNILLEDFYTDNKWRFDPHDMWKGHIEG